MRWREGGSDRRVVLLLCGVMLAVAVGVSLLEPQSAEDDPRPTTTNSGPLGAKAAYLTLQAMGRKTVEWDRPLAALSEVMTDAEAQRTTLILAAPQYDALEEKELSAEVAQFLERGGRVLATGQTGAMLLLSGGAKGVVAPPGMLKSGLCPTSPEGPGALARAGSVEMAEDARWMGDDPRYRVEQRCGEDAVVVRFEVGSGEAIWWAAAGPMENAELKNDENLRLLLATVGEGRDVVFDESLHGVTKTMWDRAKGLPLGWLAGQAALLFVLMVVSFSRRRGPVREAVTLPRSSPVEFAMSMGDLYEKAAASSVATEAAKRRLLRIVTREAGVPQGTVEEGPEAIAEALRERLGGDWADVRDHLREAKTAKVETITMGSALALVRALSEDAKKVRVGLEPRGVRGGVIGEA